MNYLAYPREVVNWLDELARLLLNASVALAFVGVMAAAVVEMVRRLPPLRRLWQERWVREWTERQWERPGYRPPLPRSEQRDSSHHGISEAISQLELLAVSGDREALYEVPPRQLTGLIGAAAEEVLTYPNEYPELLLVLARGSPRDELERLIKGPYAERKSIAFPDSTETEHGPEQAFQGPREGEYPEVDPEFLRARTRVEHQVRRSLDSLHVTLGSRWELTLLSTSVSISFVFILMFAAYVGSLLMIGKRPAALVLFDISCLLVFSAVGAIVSGFFATVVRVLVGVAMESRWSGG